LAKRTRSAKIVQKSAMNQVEKQWLPQKRQHRGQRSTEGVEDAATLQAESQKCPELTKDGDSWPTKSDSRMARSFAPPPRRSAQRGMFRPVGCQCRPPSSEGLGVTAEGIKAGENTRLASVSAPALDRGASIRIETLADLIATADTHGNIPSSADTAREITTMVNATTANTGGDTSSERKWSARGSSSGCAGGVLRVSRFPISTRITNAT
jgi:hypothetical protein